MTWYFKTCKKNVFSLMWEYKCLILFNLLEFGKLAFLVISRQPRMTEFWRLFEQLYNILNAHVHTIRYDLSSKMPVPLPKHLLNPAYQSQWLTSSCHFKFISSKYYFFSQLLLKETFWQCFLTLLAENRYLWKREHCFRKGV